MDLLLVRAMLWATALALLAAACVVDLKRRIIPNELTALVALCGIALSAVARPELIWIGLLAAVVLFLGLSVFAHYRLLGGGDAKLIAAVTLLVPPEGIGLLVLEIAVAGGLLSGIYLIAYHSLKGRRLPQIGASIANSHAAGLFDRFRRNEFRRIVSVRSVPYSLAVFIGLIAHVASELHQCSSATSCLL